jgi:phage recombination protein Bet
MTKESSAAEKRSVGRGAGRNDKLISFTEEEKDILRRTVADKASDDEFKIFLHIAETYGLDPFNKELFFWKVDKNPTIMTSRDGYLKIANMNEAFDGLVSDVIRANDRFSKNENGIEHKYGSERGKIVGAYALVYRKDRKYPVYVFSPFEEYKAHNRVWSSYPSAMILKVAESMALKRAFTVSGLVSQEEMDVIQFKKKYEKEDEQRKVTSINQPQEESRVKELSEREKEIKELVAGDAELKNDLFSYLDHIKKERGDDRKISINDLSDEEYDSLFGILNSFKKMDSRNRTA